MSGRQRYVLHFAHDNLRRFAGGLGKYIREETALAEGRGVASAVVFPLVLRQFPRWAEWAGRGWCVCRGGGLDWCGVYTWRGLANLLGRWERRGWALSEMQLHHIGGYRADDLRRFFGEVPARARLILHDYHTVCRSALLLRNGREHCGTSPPCETKCRGCRYWDPAWLPTMKSVLGGLEDRLRVTAPSKSAAAAWLESWPEFRGRVEVVPHWIPVRTARGPGRVAGTRLRVAFAGAPLPHKGWDVWNRVVQAVQAAGKPMDFLYFGLAGTPPDGVRTVRTDEGEMPALLRKEEVDVLCLWSTCPETYSYVYHEAVQAGTWVVAPTVSGNIADAICKTGWGTVLGDEGELRSFLLDGRRLRATLAKAREVERPEEMAVNPKLLDELPEWRPLGLRAGRAGRSWTREAVWKLKEWSGHA